MKQASVFRKHQQGNIINVTDDLYMIISTKIFNDDNFDADFVISMVYFESGFIFPRMMIIFTLKCFYVNNSKMHTQPQ